MRAEGLRREAPVAALDSSLSEGFRIGDVEISPSGNELRRHGRSTLLEPKAMDVLCALAARQGETASRPDLLDAVWGRAFGCDESLTRAVYLLRRAFAALGAPSPIGTVPRRGYRLAAPATPLPDRAGAEAFLPGPGRAQALSGRRAAIAAACFACVLLALSLLPGQGVRNPAEAGMRQVAIAPFSSLPATPATAELSRLLTDRLSSLLAAHDDPVSIGAPPRGGGAYILGGSVVGAGGDDLVSIRLLTPDRRTLLWSADFRRSGRDRADFAEEVAWRMTAALTCAKRLLSAVERPTAQLRRLAMGYCHEAQAYTHGPRLADRSRALLAAAPDDPALLGLHALSLACAIELPPAARAASAALAERALGLAPEQGEARLALKLAKARAGRYAAREVAYREALSLDPANSCIVQHYAFFLRTVGRVEDARRLLGRLAERAPHDGHAFSELAWLDATGGDLPAARRNLAEASRRVPESEWVMQRIFEVEALHGDPAVALSLIDDAPLRMAALGGGFRDCLHAYARRRAGLIHAEADVFEACELTGRSVRVRVHAALGDLDRAFALAAEIPDHPGQAAIMLFYPEMRAFRSDERFWRYAAKRGLVEYWRKTGHRPDFCRQDHAAARCQLALEAA